MHVVTTIAGVRTRRRELWRCGRTVAFVPTMGALHDGHLSLVDHAAAAADEVWASVFVNPTQFGPGEDLDAYPRDLDRDRTLLQQRGVSLLFAPGEKEMYPRPTATRVTVPALAAGLCGTSRAGHFDGVALVVAKLLNIVQPDVLVLGAKDWQQSVVVRRMVGDLDLPVRVLVAPTVRAADGLALSSRNAYLARDERARAAVVHRALCAGAERIAAGERSRPAVEARMAAEVATVPEARLQYVAAVDPETLAPADPLCGPRCLLAVAVTVGRTRLIDNLLVEVPRC